MTYTPDVPLPNQKPSVSQPIMRTNFNQLNTVFDDNHYAFNNATNAGDHRFSRYIPVVNPIAGAGNGVVYVETLAGVPELKWHRNGGSHVQMSGPDPLNNAFGYTFLPGGMLMMWGTRTTPGSPAPYSFTISFPQIGGMDPFTGSPYNVQISWRRILHPGSPDVVYLDTSSYTTSDFTVTITSSEIDKISWLAIGPR